ncbi:MAG: hypothetical protein IPK68_05240 [Bdellovibrionales bacterium]|nr:hypothetical protein [Bdellovibrionales bacterium]
MPQLRQWIGIFAIIFVLNEHQFAEAGSAPSREPPSSRGSDIASQSGDLGKDDGEALLQELTETEHLERELRDNLAKDTIKQVTDRNPAWFSLPPANSEKARLSHQDSDVDEKINAFHRGQELHATPVPKLSIEELEDRCSPRPHRPPHMTRDKTTKNRKFITITFKE